MLLQIRYFIMFLILKRLNLLVCYHCFILVYGLINLMIIQLTPPPPPIPPLSALTEKVAVFGVEYNQEKLYLGLENGRQYIWGGGGVNRGAVMGGGGGCIL